MAKKADAPAKPFEIPTLEDAPEYLKVKQKEAQLKQDLSDAYRERESVLDRIRRRGERQLSRVSEEASALAKGRSISPEDTMLGRSLGDIDHRIEVLKRAIEIVRCELIQVRSKVAPDLVKPLVPEHRSRVRASVFSLVDCAQALHSERDLRQALEHQAIPHSGLIPPMGFARVARRMSLRQFDSMLVRFVSEAIERGYVNASEIKERVPLTKTVAGVLAAAERKRNEASK